MKYVITKELGVSRYWIQEVEIEGWRYALWNGLKDNAKLFNSYKEAEDFKTFHHITDGIIKPV